MLKKAEHKAKHSNEQPRKEHHKEAPKLSSRKKTILVFAILALILALALHYALTHWEGISLYGDDPVYVSLAGYAANGTFMEEIGYIFTVRLAEIYGIALFFKLFGTTDFVAGLWNTMSYIGIIIVTFLFVRMYYDDKAALTSAFLVTIFPLISKYALNISDDIPLTFFGSLAILLFIYAERTNKKYYYFASGLLLVFIWLITYESGIIILFTILLAIVEVLRGKVKINTDSIFFLYGIIFLFLVVFIFSYYNSHLPFLVITENTRFYSAVGTQVNGLATIPSTNTNLTVYPNAMFQYNIWGALTSKPYKYVPLNLYNTLFPLINTSEYGLYFYLIIPMILVLLALREKRSYFFIAWFLFVFAFLEAGPMHVGITLHPFSITYLLAYRLLRFMLIITVPLCAIMGIAMAKLLEFKNRYLLAIGIFFFLAILALLYANNYSISSFWYYWQRYPEDLMIPAANYLKAMPNAQIYLEGSIPPNDVPISYSSSAIETYLGRPAATDVNYSITTQTSCSSFRADSYIIWSGPPMCVGWVDVLNITKYPPGIPIQIINADYPTLPYPVTNIYYYR